MIKQYYHNDQTWVSWSVLLHANYFPIYSLVEETACIWQEDRLGGAIWQWQGIDAWDIAGKFIDLYHTKALIRYGNRAFKTSIAQY